MTKHIANGLLAAMLGLAMTVTGITHEAPEGGYVRHAGSASTTEASKPANVPTWQPEYAARFAGCAASLPSGVIPSSVVVVDITGDVSRMDFDQAWKVTHNDSTADDVWIVGACR